MERITVSLGERSYPISIGAGLFDDPAHLSFLSNPNSSAKQKVVVISNVTVAPIYAEKIPTPSIEHSQPFKHGLKHSSLISNGLI